MGRICAESREYPTSTLASSTGESISGTSESRGPGGKSVGQASLLYLRAHAFWAAGPVTSLLTDEAKARSMGEAGRERALARFTPEAVAEEAQDAFARFQ